MKRIFCVYGIRSLGASPSSQENTDFASLTCKLFGLPSDVETTSRLCWLIVLTTSYIQVGYDFVLLVWRASPLTGPSLVKGLAPSLFSILKFYSFWCGTPVTELHARVFDRFTTAMYLPDSATYQRLCIRTNNVTVTGQARSSNNLIELLTR